MREPGELSPGRLIWRLLTLQPGLNGLHLFMQVARSLILLLPGLLLRVLFEYLEQQQILPAADPFARLPWGLLVLLVTIGVVRAFSIVGTIFVQSTIWGYDTARMRNSLVRRALERPQAHQLPLPAGDAANRLSIDVSELGQFVAEFYNVIGVSVLAAASMIIMLSIRWQVAIFATLPVLLLAIVLRAAQNRLQSYRQASRLAQSKVTAFLGEMFGSIQAVQVATAEGRVLDRFSQINEQRKETVLRERLFEQLNVLAIFNNITNFTIGMILLLAARAMAVDEAGRAAFSVGDFSLFVYLMAQVTDFLLTGSWWLASYRQQQASIERLLPLLGTEGDVALLAPAGPLQFKQESATMSLPKNFGLSRLLALQADNLTFRYKGSTQGIQDISFKMEAGGLTVIAGRIGSGKTTLLRALLGLVPLDKGEIYWNGKHIAQPAIFFQPPVSAFVPQIPRLISETLAENILLGLPLDFEALKLAADQAVLTGDIEQLANGLATEIGPRGVKLSGGQAQRAAAARMFVRRPALIVCDDLSSALDVETEQRLWRNLLQDGVERPACLIVSHQRPVWQQADQILLLDDGQLSDQGTLDELLNRSSIMRELWQQTS